MYGVKNTKPYIESIINYVFFSALCIVDAVCNVRCLYNRVNTAKFSLTLHFLSAVAPKSDELSSGLCVLGLVGSTIVLFICEDESVAVHLHALSSTQGIKYKQRLKRLHFLFAA